MLASLGNKTLTFQYIPRKGPIVFDCYLYLCVLLFSTLFYATLKDTKQQPNVYLFVTFPSLASSPLFTQIQELQDLPAGFAAQQ